MLQFVPYMSNYIVKSYLLKPPQAIFHFLPITTLSWVMNRAARQLDRTIPPLPLTFRQLINPPITRYITALFLLYPQPILSLLLEYSCSTRLWPPFVVGVEEVETPSCRFGGDRGGCAVPLEFSQEEDCQDDKGYQGYAANCTPYYSAYVVRACR